MDYHKKYLKYKSKYFQLKSLGKYDVEISNGNPLGIVEFVTSEQFSSYQISGIISCIGIVVRSYKEIECGLIKLINGQAVHFIHGDLNQDHKYPDQPHFIDIPEGKSKLTDQGNVVIKKFENFINENKENKIQLDFITSGDSNNIHKSTQYMVNTLIERFKKLTCDIEIKQHKGISSITITPQIWGF